jgi:LmbE family N-acetylglucosaminyl deacetylase
LPPSAHVAAARHAVALVPASAAVSTTNHLGAHLATRRHLYVFPVIRSATWVVADAKDPYMPDLRWLRTRRGIGVGTRDLYFQPNVMRRILRKLNESPVWTRVFTQDGISVFSRRGGR